MGRLKAWMREHHSWSLRSANRSHSRRGSFSIEAPWFVLFVFMAGQRCCCCC